MDPLANASRSAITPRAAPASVQDDPASPASKRRSVRAARSSRVALEGIRRGKLALRGLVAGLACRYDCDGSCLQRHEAVRFQRSPRLGLQDGALVPVHERQEHKRAERPDPVALIPDVTRAQDEVRILPRDLELQVSLGDRVVGEAAPDVEPVLQRDRLQVAVASLR